MLIYVNEFKLSHKGATNQALNTICGWLKTKTQETFSVDMLKSGENFSCGDGVYVRTFGATKNLPYMHSILFTHPDVAVKGRYWETELSVTEYEDHSTFSILLKTNDVSTQVRSLPTTTRPKVVGFLNNNRLLSKDTIGLEYEEVNSIDGLYALKSQVFDETRSYPIILVSSTEHIHCGKLQAQLLGLAKVVSLDESLNSYDIEEIMGRSYSAWAGAVNIIYPKLSRQQVGTSLLRADIIYGWVTEGKSVIHELLSLITHSTNRYYSKKHFSPTDIRAKRQKDQRDALKLELQLNKTDSDSISLEEFVSELDNAQQGHEAELQSWIRKLNDAETASYEYLDQYEVVKNNLVQVEAELETLKSQSELGGGIPLLFKGEEQELYEGEFLYHLQSALQRSIEDSKDNSRRNHVLRDIKESNNSVEDIFEAKRKLKDLFASYKNLTSDIRDAFSELNIEVVTESGHHKAKFLNDDRYTLTFSKTPSCSRAGMNITKDLNKEFL